MLNKKEIYCPSCGEKIFFCLDEWGYTPIHLHCKKDNINIGATSFEKCIQLLIKYHTPKTYIEFYNNEIKFLHINGEVIINNE